MVAKLKTPAADMVAAARVEIREIETPDLIAMLEDPKLVVVDILGEESAASAHLI